jgi:hypothetical protein
VPDMHRRIEECVQSWPSDLQRAFQSYWTGLCVSRNGRMRSGEEQAAGKYWLLLPSWLDHRHARILPATTEGLSPFVSNVLWGQYALFVAVRIQDDLFDGQANPPILVFAADRLLLEAEEAFRRASDLPPDFWKVYQDCRQATSQAIVETDLLLQKESTSSDALLKEYAAVSSIFKLGSAAVCFRAGRLEDFVHAERFCDEMAQVLQILDDLEDVVDDLERGRGNCVSRIIGVGLPTSGDRALYSGLVAEQLFGRGMWEPVLVEALKHLGAAEDALRPVALPESGPYVAAQRGILGGMEALFTDGDREELSARLFRTGGLDALLRSRPVSAWQA